MSRWPSLRRIVAGAALAAVQLTITTNASAQGYPCPMPGQTGSCTLQSAPLAPLDPLTQPKFVNELPQPIFYQPDTTTFPGFDYYEVQVAPVTQLQVAFPQPGAPAPAGAQWLGLVDPLSRAPLFTPLWGYGQVNNAAFPLNGLTTYPSMSFKATKGRPVKVKWINNTPDNHLFCPSPLDSNVPCAIDRTLMGTLVRPGESVNPYGGPQQPDNAVVIHLHGGEIPPDSDGLAELWIGNATTSAAYSQVGGLYYKPPTPLLDSLGQQVPGVSSNIDPPFIPPPVNGLAKDAAYPTANGPVTVPPSVYAPGQLIRPTGDSIFYNYPMVQEAATIWYHDHALGKTRINVVAGPAGYFYVTDPPKEARLRLPSAGDCTNAGILAGNCYDIPIALQDRSFNADGTINFPNGLGQAAPAGVVGWNPLTPGPNPTVHPQWVPEYFGDAAVVNGVAWPKITVEPRPYRFRILDGSNARCWTLDLVAQRPGLLGGPYFYQIGTDQGYTTIPVPLSTLTLCPGERSEVIIDFSRFAGQTINVVNTAGAPFPNGFKPQDPGSPFSQLAIPFRFQVTKPVNPAFPARAWLPLTTLAPVAPLPTAGAVRRQMVLNEVLDPVTLAPLRVQIDGKAFEEPVTETPKRGQVEVWTMINTTVDAHPMHLHLVKFQVLSRQRFDSARYITDSGLDTLATGGLFTKLPVAPYLLGRARGPNIDEVGAWKDTAKVWPGEILTVAARFDGKWADKPSTTNPALPYFEAVTSGPYVWHCHIVDHEDNEMMRPLLVVP